MSKKNNQTNQNADGESRQVKQIVSKPHCDICDGRKTVPVFDWYDGKFRGSRKCYKCNNGTWFPKYENDYFLYT
jgi:hypothetical protein